MTASATATVAAEPQQVVPNFQKPATKLVQDPAQEQEIKELKLKCRALVE